MRLHIIKITAILKHIYNMVSFKVSWLTLVAKSKNIYYPRLRIPNLKPYLSGTSQDKAPKTLRGVS